MERYCFHGLDDCVVVTGAGGRITGLLWLFEVIPGNAADDDVVAGAAVGRATSRRGAAAVVSPVPELILLISTLITGTSVGRGTWSMVVVVCPLVLFDWAFALTRSLFARRLQIPSVPAIELTAIMYLKEFETNCFLRCIVGFSMVIT